MSNGGNPREIPGTKASSLSYVPSEEETDLADSPDVNETAHVAGARTYAFAVGSLQPTERRSYLNFKDNNHGRCKGF